MVLVAAPLSLYLSFLLVDLQRRTDGAGFYVNGGRYLLPAYAAVATLLVIGLGYLVQRGARPLVFAAVAGLATYFSWRVLEVNYLHRYFGDESIGELLRRLTYDRPEFITRGTLWVLLVLIAVSLAAFAVVLARGALSAAPTARE